MALCEPQPPLSTLAATKAQVLATSSRTETCTCAVCLRDIQKLQCHKSIETSYRKSISQKCKTCRAGFHKKPTKQDGTHMTIRSQITIPTSIFPTTHTIIPYSLFWNGCVYLCVVNSRIGLWGLWVGVCIEGSRE